MTNRRPSSTTWWPFFLTPWPRNLGNCAEEIQFALLKARREGRRLLMFRPWSLWRGRFSLDSTNAELWNVESPYRIELPRPASVLVGLAIGTIFGVRRGAYLAWRRLQRGASRIWPRYQLAPFNPWLTLPSIGRSELWQPRGTKHLDWEVVRRLDWAGQLGDPIPVDLPQRSLATGAGIRKEMGMSPDDWFVCLHVREGGFRRDGAHGASRNASIVNYLKAIRLITSRGGWVVRLGDPTMTPLPEMLRVIDYARSRWKCDLMDMFLIRTCRYYLGINSGPADVAWLFRRRTALVNLSEWALAFAPNEGDVAVIKHVYSRSRGRFLSLQEILDQPFDVQSFGTPGSDYELAENSSDEICAAVEDLLTEPAHPLTEKQVQFNAGRARQIERWLADSRVFDGSLPSVVEQYRIAARTGVAGAISRAYVEQNWSEDSMNRYADVAAAVQ